MSDNALMFALGFCSGAVAMLVSGLVLAFLAERERNIERMRVDD